MGFENRAGPGRLDRFPRTISGVLPGLLSLPHRGWDEGRAQPDRRSNPYAARKLSCRRRDWRRFEVSLVRGASVKARMRALSIVEVEIAAQRRASFRDRVVGFELYLLVFYGFPEPLDENIVAPGAPAVHADGDPVREQDAGERLAGELAALVGIENFRFAMFADGLLQRLDAKAGLHRDRHTMGEHTPGEPIDDRDQIDEAARHRDIGNIRRPDLIGPLDLHAAQQIGINLVARRGFR